MKNLIKSVIVITVMAVAVLFTGCEQFFSNESPSTMDAAVFASAEQTEQVIAGIYEILGEERSYRSRLAGPWVVPGTDCEMYTAGAPSFAIYTMQSDGHTDLVQGTKNPWSYLTIGIERANVAISGIETYSDTTKDVMRYLYGEALTLRAWMTYEMTKLWGDIPYMFTPLDGTDATLYPKKVDRNQVYEKLREDLRHAAQLMPNAAECPGNANNTVERPNREFALGLLARIDLVYAGKALRPDKIERGSSYKVQFNTTPEKRVELLNEAMWACEEVISADGLGKLMGEYEDVFRAVSGSVVEYGKTESLWEIPFADNVRGQFMNRMGAYVNKNTVKKRLLHFPGTGNSNAKIVVPPSFLFSFDPQDKRKWVTVSPGEWIYNDESKIEGTTGKVLYQKPEKIVKMYLGKYRHEWLAADMAKDDDGVNVPQMRFADVLLMYAEASIGSVCEVQPTYAGKYDGAELFNRVRTRAGLPATTLTMENLMQERAWEFAGEFIRKYDLMRWGVFADKLWTTQEDIANFTHLDAEEGKIDFSGTPYEGKLPTSIYVKYTPDQSVAFNESTSCYRISQIYGLTLGENDVPEGYVSTEETGGWVKIDAFLDGGAPAAKIGEDGNRVFGVDLSKEELESHQYWPIFDDVLSSNNNLWNDYGY